MNLNGPSPIGFVANLPFSASSAGQIAVVAVMK